MAINKLRDELNFNSLDALIAAIANDVKMASDALDQLEAKAAMGLFV